MPSTSAVAALLGASLALLPYGSTKDATFARLRRRRQPLERLRKEIFLRWVCATFFSAATPLEIQYVRIITYIYMCPSNSTSTYPVFPYVRVDLRANPEFEAQSTLTVRFRECHLRIGPTFQMKFVSKFQCFCILFLRSFQELTLKPKGSTQNGPVLGPPAELSSGPMLPFNVALEDGSVDSSDAWRATSREAAAQDLLLGDGAELEISEDPVTDLCENLGFRSPAVQVAVVYVFLCCPLCPNVLPLRNGVARVPSVLSKEVASEMYHFVLEDLAQAQAAVEARDSSLNLSSMIWPLTFGFCFTLSQAL